ncbi:PAS domain protein [Halomicronema hongdechloris C2206]|uniref:histidine kinase n=1 Tax=Halomicronema hongdechloris C2206 TaxID=1641165 RepID=A0A1Z3HUN0_9CYAN|nr:PAS domain S-box protein [Halomicronema hongdechloris]ASC73972.1 PAS domain protein [Halomicronema hongdechloris C2206]
MSSPFNPAPSLDGMTGPGVDALQQLADLPVAAYCRHIDAEGRLVAWDAALEAMVGPLTAGQGWQQWVVPQDWPRVRQMVAEAVTTRQPFTLNYRIQRQDGRVCWLCDRGQVTSRCDDLTLYLTGVVFELPDRVVAPEYPASDVTNQAIIRALPDLILRMRRDSPLYEIVTPGNVNLLMAEGEILNIFDVMPAEQAHKRLHYVAQALDMGMLQIYDQVLFYQDQMQHEEVRVVPCGGDQVLVIVRDVTDHRRAEATLQRLNQELETRVAERTQALQASEADLRTLFDHIYAAIFIIALDGTLLDVNQTMLSLYGVARQEALQRSFLADYSGPNNAPEQLAQAWQQALAGDTPAFEWQAQRLDTGQCFEVEVVLQQVTLGQQQVVLANVRDIRDRKQVECLLRESQQLLQLVMDNIPQLIFWKDRQSVYLGCNRQFAKSIGIDSPEAIVGQRDAELPWTPQEREWYLRCDRTVIETNQPLLNMLETHHQDDGNQIWLEANKLPLHDSEGQVVGILGTLQDITERKQAEDLLREQVRLSTLRAAIDSILTRGEPLQAMLQGCTEALVKILEGTVAHLWLLDAGQQLLQRQATAGYPDTAPPLPDQMPLATSSLGQIVQQRCPYLSNDLSMDPQMQAPWGGHADLVAFAGYPLIVEDQVLGVLAVGVRKLLKPSLQGWLALLANEIALGIKRKQTELALQQSEARLRQQTHDLEHTLRELQQAQLQLIQSEKMSSLGQLVAGVAHEINNPMNFIYGNLNHARTYIEDLLQLIELYQQHYADPAPAIATAIHTIDLPFLLDDLPKLLNSMKVGADRIQTIVSSLSTFSRMDTATAKVVDIHENLDSTLMILQYRLKARGERPAIQVTRHYGDIPPVHCYPGHLNQVFMNILGNAIDALEEVMPRHPHPQLQIQTAMDSQGRLVVTIADNGPGIPADIQPRLFDPFFTSKPLGKGTGLGLSISYQIVTEIHRGQLRCQSQVGQSTCFTIILPQPLPQSPAPDHAATLPGKLPNASDYLQS